MLFLALLGFLRPHAKPQHAWYDDEVLTLVDCSGGLLRQDLEEAEKFWKPVHKGIHYVEAFGDMCDPETLPWGYARVYALPEAPDLRGRPTMGLTRNGYIAVGDQKRISWAVVFIRSTLPRDELNLTVLHEVGHVLGYADNSNHDIMHWTQGARKRLPR